MNAESDYIKTVFGLKLKQQRQKKKWSLQDLADKTGVSKSYLNEIENGKKYPKHDKILQLSEVLECKFDDLVSTKLDKSLAPISEILKSDFFKDIPLELFGINRNLLISIISESPKKVTAFLNTLIEISQNYNLGKERFYFAVVRSFQEMHDNFFPEIEEKAQQFCAEHHFDQPKTINCDFLTQLLIQQHGYNIEIKNFDYFGEASHLRSLYIPEKRTLLLNERLDDNQKTFILAKELGFNILNLKPRPNTYSWLDFGGFEELLNNFFASYFAGGILISKQNLIHHFTEFIQQKTWSALEFENLIDLFTNSPETFYYRLTNILSHEFGIKDSFYLCFTQKGRDQKIEIMKELHLNQQQAPHAKATNEHYCRRWVAVKNMINLKENERVSDAQISNYVDHGLSYLVLSTSQKNPFSDGTNRSYCLGILLNSSTVKKIKFSKDINIKSEKVGVTCETCSIQDCEVRQAPPVRLEKENFNENIKRKIQQIRQLYVE